MKTSSSSRNSLTIGVLLTILAQLCVASTAPHPARADGIVRQDGREKKEHFTDEDLKVEVIKGRWSALSTFDEKQLNDPSVPVYVKGINMFWGRGKFLGRMKIPEVVLENRSPQQASSVRLRWTVTTQDDPDVVLLEGVTPLFEARINPYSAARVDIPEIYFNKILKPLRKEEELNGRFRLVLGVQEVQFSDGQQWPLSQAASYMAISYAKRLRDYPPLNLGPFAYFYGVTSGVLTRPTPNAAPCENWPGPLAPAFFFYAGFQIETDPPCRENRACDTDPNTAQSVCTVLTGSYCDQGGCVEGWCNCYMALGPCTTCPDNDGDYHTAERCGGDDCDDNNDAVYRNAPEYCGDTFDNDCDGKADCADETCWRPEYCSNCPQPCDITTCPASCLGDADPCQWPDNQGCPRTFLRSGNCCYRPSPIIVDVRGDGFDLTDLARGVRFDLNADGTPEKLAWTKAGSDDAWLALDRGGDGSVDSGQELFGNFTPQPDPPRGEERNGFLALAEYDRPAQGGNGDRVIDARDAVFASLLLWQDVNHDGVSQAGELHTIAALGLKSIELDYKESKRADRHGNQFLYRAKVRDARGTNVGRWAWDVFLVAEP
jgi:hypothetical protein